MASYMSVFKYLEIQLEDIKSATNNFHDSRVIGSGGFGNVYKGELSHPEGKIEVAFKRLNRKHGQGDPEFFKEIRMLSSYKHDNLISLLGYCNEGNEMILMYEYAARGSLERILNDAALTWTQRLKICIDAAKGLSFLHDPNGTQQRVLHRDIKSANILLDENLNAKVADFGLSKISPANQPNTFLVTSPVGTHGYCDPLYMFSYQLTKESDVYSFGVVLLEVLFGRVCYENTNRQLKIFVPYWKKCYEQKKLDEIIFPNLKQQMDPSSVKTFVDIAYQCLQKSREQRPEMSLVVEKLKVALELKLAAEYEYGEILKFADPPLIYKSMEELKALLSKGLLFNGGKTIIQAADPPLIYKSNMELIETLTKGVRVNGGKTMLLINEKGGICERICIEACLDQIQYNCLEDPSDYENSRFPGRRCYSSYANELKVHVRAEFLCPLITYSVNLVLRYPERMRDCKTLHYKLNWEKFFCMVYDAYKREDGWFVVPLYQFTSDHKTADFEIHFEGFRYDCKLQVAGFEFHPLEEKVELHDEGLEEYQDIVKVASQSLFYKSLEELKVLLTKGFHINNHKTVEHEQVLDDENLSYNNLQWTIMKEEKKLTNILKWFKKEHRLLDNGQEAYAVDKDGMKSVMFSARGVIQNWDLSFQSSTESRFGEVVEITHYQFKVEKKIKSDVLSPETAYAIYLIYKLPQYHSQSKGLLRITNHENRNLEDQYIYLVSPPETPIIGQKLDQNTHNPLIRPKLNEVPRQRGDGWMELKVGQFQTPTSTETINFDIWLGTPDYKDIRGLIIESIELKPIVREVIRNSD
ncbi:kinase-like domain, phloem protein 2-like protein [Tanacetum coccineum]|uniref:Kinase-like domain, phloem protein 2-like protein n=1 Tax=Tanacetum coccineum TaxID=301880 RepID=A0ABQ5HNQ5_9ASTR